mgnify:CR=1 FL=1
MSKISVENTLAVHGQRTYTSSGVVAGATTTPAKNTTGFTSQYAIQFGEIGQDQTEVVIGTVASGTSFTHPALAFDHSSDTPIFDIKFNQVVLEKSASGTAGVAAPITDGTISYKPDHWDQDLQLSLTIFDDTAGATTDAYKTMFRNSVLGSNSSESDWITPAGASFYSLANITERVKAEMWNPTFIQDDDRIHNWINEWKDKMTTSLISLNKDYALGTVEVAFGTAGLGTLTSADFRDVRRFWTTFNGVDSFQSTKMNINDYLPDQVYSSAHPYHAWQGNTVFQIKPDGQAGTARLVYYQLGTTLQNETDELPLPFRGYTDSFVAYAVAKAYFLDGKTNEYSVKVNEAEKTKDTFIREMSTRDRSGPTYIDIIDPTGVDDKAW